MLNRIAEWGNLFLAYNKANKGKRGRPDVAAFEHRLEDHLWGLRKALLDRTYQPGDYQSFYIHDPKRRLISAAPFRDRVIHHALCNIIEPVFERSFLPDSFANRIGFGTHRATAIKLRLSVFQRWECKACLARFYKEFENIARLALPGFTRSSKTSQGKPCTPCLLNLMAVTHRALAAAQAYARRYRFVLQMDLRHFFPSIDHALLRSLLAKKLNDESVLWLIDLILASGESVLIDEYKMVYFLGDDLFSVLRPRGLPIGNLTSQFWANVYLNPIDHYIKRELRCPGYVRYVDDLLLFAKDKASLWEWHTGLIERFAKLRLTAHDGAHPRPVIEGIPYLGFLLYPNYRRLKSRKGVYYRRRLTSMLGDWEAQRLSSEDVAASVNGWVNHVRYGNTVGLQAALLQDLPIEIRSLLYSQKL